MLVEMSTENSHKVFVGGLTPATTSETLQAYFSQFGEVSEAKVVIDKITGNSKCFGFVCLLSVVVIQIYFKDFFY